MLLFCWTLTGCDRIYGLLHKPGGEERQNLGAFEFNAYNARVEQLQKMLKSFGYTIGYPDGKFGASTREAVARFQQDENIKVTRFVDHDTWARMQAYIQGPLFKDGQIDIKAVQKALTKAGFPSGKPDGRLGKQTREAIKAFQRSQQLDADGYLGLKTIKALQPYAVSLPAVSVNPSSRSSGI